MQISKILVPTDGPDAADRLYAYAMDLARLTGAAIVVMHAYNPPAALRKRGALALDVVANGRLGGCGHANLFKKSVGSGLQSRSRTPPRQDRHRELIVHHGEL